MMFEQPYIFFVPGSILVQQLCVLRELVLHGCLNHYTRRGSSLNTVFTSLLYIALCLMTVMGTTVQHLKCARTPGLPLENLPLVTSLAVVTVMVTPPTVQPLNVVSNCGRFPCAESHWCARLFTCVSASWDSSVWGGAQSCWSQLVVCLKRGNLMA